MGLAVLALVLPHDVLLVLAWLVQQLAGLLIGLVHLGHSQPWLVLLMAVGLNPWIINSHRGLRGLE